MAEPLVAVRGATRRFGAVTALSDVSLDLVPGRVAAIVGENGAGKSTLAKIVAGMERLDAGTLSVEGRPAVFRSRRDAIAAGIGFVPQTLSLVPTLSIADNHRLAGRGIVGDRTGQRRKLETAAATLGLPLDLDRRVERLSLAERQMGEIAAAVAEGARVLLLDEPTSTLGPAEIARLIAAVRRLAGEGIAIGLVTHRVREVLEGADSVTVLRGGEGIFQGDTAGLDPAAVARLMVGERKHGRTALAAATSAWERLRVEGLTLREDGQRLLDGISFAVREGEILGIAGVSGAAQPALAEAIAGLRGLAAGAVQIDGVAVTGDPAAACRAGLAYVPEDRRMGLAPGLPVSANAALLHLREPAFRRFGLRRLRAEVSLARRVVERFDVRPARTDIAADNLSGGNAQKLLVGRELERGPAVVVVHGPTQGLDLAAASAIRTALAAAAAEGAAVVVLSADLDEILDLCHRLVVLAGGRITDRMTLDGPPDLGRLGAAMAGTTLPETAA
jgi:ABC-type uncharacterized transport system ATPase subunit